MKKKLTILTVAFLLTTVINAQNIPWSTDYQGGECTLALPEWDGFIGDTTYDNGFIHTVNITNGTSGYDGTIAPYQTKVVRVLMAPGVETVYVGGTWSHTYSGYTLHGFLPGELNQEGGFSTSYEPGQVCASSCTGTFINPTTELYLYASFLNPQKTITRTGLGIPIDQPIWLSYVMYQDNASNSNTNVNLSFNCNVLGDTNVAIYRNWLSERPWYTPAPGTGSYDGVYEYWHTMKINFNNIKTNAISLYPNPSTGQFTIEGNDIQEIEIIDITGKVVLQTIIEENTTTKQSINLESHAKGIYTARIKTGNSIIMKKIIKI